MIKWLCGLALVGVLAGFLALPGNAQQLMVPCFPTTSATSGVQSCTTTGYLTALLNQLSTTVTSVKRTPGWLGSIYCFNTGSATAYVQVFNVISNSVTLGTTKPQVSLGIPATQASGFAFSNAGVKFDTAISVAATSSATNSTISAGQVDCNAFYN